MMMEKEVFYTTSPAPSNARNRDEEWQNAKSDHAEIGDSMKAV